MTKLKTVTTAFNSGELSPKVAGRIDLNQYYNGCKSLRNTIVYPQGGCSKRHGLELIDVLPRQDMDKSQVRIEPFIFNPEEKYVVILSNKLAWVYDCYERKLIATINTPYNGSEIHQVSVYQSQDVMLMSHHKHPPQRIVRDRSGATTQWKIEPIVIKNQPYYDFDNGLPVGDPRPTIQTFELDLGTQDISFKIKLEGVESSLISIGRNDEASTIRGKLQSAIQGIVVPDKGSPRISLEQSGDYDQRQSKFVITFLGEGKEAVWDIMEIVDLTGVTDSGPTITMTQTGIVEGEPVWSDKRGYPAVVALHQGRLWFGGSTSRPQTLWASRSANYYDFGIADPDNLLANDSMEITLNDTRSNLITAMASTKTLLVFTSGGVFTIDGENGLITPTTVFALKQSEFGSKYTPPVQLDNTTMYLQAQGAQLNAISYAYATDSYASSPQAMLSDHLLKKPRSMSVISASDDYNSNFMFVVNSDGTLAMFNSLAAQEISTWTPFSTDGFICSTAGVYNEMWCVVKREASFALECYGEESQYMDGSVAFAFSSPEKLIPSNKKLRVHAGKEGVALVDGYPISIKFNSDGSVLLPFAVESGYVGLPIDMEIETMPFNANIQSGSPRFSRKRVYSVKLDMIDSLGFDVEYCNRKYKVADRRMGFKLKTPPQPTTEVKTVKLLGYSTDGNIKITSKEPVAVNLRSLQLNISLTG